MKITLRGKNIEITEAIEEKVSEKLSKLDKYFIVSENVEAKVLVRTYPYGQKIEVTIPTEYAFLSCLKNTHNKKSSIHEPFSTYIFLNFLPYLIVPKVNLLLVYQNAHKKLSFYKLVFLNLRYE